MSNQKKSRKKETKKTEKFLMPLEILYTWQDLVLKMKFDNLDKDLYMSCVKQKAEASQRAIRKLAKVHEVTATLLKALEELEKAKEAGLPIIYPTEEDGDH